MSKQFENKYHENSKITYYSHITFGYFFKYVSQDLDVEVVEDERIFTSKDKCFIQHWYYEQVVKMDFDKEGVDDYSSLLLYYTYKMGRLRLAKQNYTDSEIKARFNELVVQLNLEMKDFLSDKDYNTQIESFKLIEDVLYEKKKWER